MDRGHPGGKRYRLATMLFFSTLVAADNGGDAPNTVT